MSDLFHAAEARALRDAGMQRVRGNSHDFMAKGLAAIGALPTAEYTGENIRTHLLCRGIEPHHPNAWGALICSAVRRGILTGTGRYQAMTAAKSHARKTEVYRK